MVIPIIPIWNVASQQLRGPNATIYGPEMVGQFQPGPGSAFQLWQLPAPHAAIYPFQPWNQSSIPLVFPERNYASQPQPPPGYYTVIYGAPLGGQPTIVGFYLVQNAGIYVQHDQPEAMDID